jgi:hypothetical protein
MAESDSGQTCPLCSQKFGDPDKDGQYFLLAGQVG